MLLVKLMRPAPSSNLNSCKNLTAADGLVVGGYHTKLRWNPTELLRLILHSARLQSRFSQVGHPRPRKIKWGATIELTLELLNRQPSPNIWPGNSHCPRITASDLIPELGSEHVKIPPLRWPSPTEVYPQLISASINWARGSGCSFMLHNSSTYGTPHINAVDMNGVAA